MTSVAMLTAAEAAERLGVNTRSLARWASQGRIEFIQLPSGHRRYRASDVDRIAAGGLNVVDPKDAS